MKTKTIINRIAWVFAALVLAVLVCLQSIPIPAFADEAEIEYSSVMDDLKKDESFNASDYPAKANDYSLQIIQIAESVNGELFVYVYQPSDGTKELTATSINLSTQEDGENYAHYGLKLLSTDGVFDKYVVENFEIKPIVLRYYYIASIFRAFDEAIDEPPTDDNMIEEVSCGVGLLWTATTVNGAVSYMVDSFDLITIEEKHVGFIRYVDLKLFGTSSYTDSHYVAFSTNKPIDTLLEAELSFKHQRFMTTTHYGGWGHKDTSTSEEIESETKKLFASDIFEDNNWFPFVDDYKYNRIQTTEVFLKNETEEFTDEAKEALAETEWVLRFYESEYNYYPYSDGTSINPCQVENITWTTVTGVTILRLEYKYQGDIYNLGVVDNVQQGDSNPDNENWTEGDVGCKDIPWIALIAIIVLILLLPFLSSILSPIVGLVIDVISIPFKWLGSLFRGGKDK